MNDQFDADLAAGRAGFLQAAGRAHDHDATLGSAGPPLDTPAGIR